MEWRHLDDEDFGDTRFEILTYMITLMSSFLGCNLPDEAHIVKDLEG
jgi:hypothetical protein